MKTKFEIIFLTLVFTIVSVGHIVLIAKVGLSLIEKFDPVEFMFLAFLVLLALAYTAISFALIRSLSKGSE